MSNIVQFVLDAKLQKKMTVHRRAIIAKYDSYFSWMQTQT